MKHLLLFLRYLVFGLFLVGNAIVCSVSIWNLSIAQSAGEYVPIDVFLAFLGGFALVFIICISFIEILRKHALTSRLWFETAWISCFWIMELSGAAALSAIVPVCGTSNFSGNGGCTSTRVLMAFSWIVTIALLAYLVTLLCTAIIRQKQDPQIWHADVSQFCRFNGRRTLTSAPSSPGLPRFTRSAPSVIAPQPRRAPQAMVDYAHRAGLGPEYQIEHFQLPALTTEVSSASSPMPSLYPEHLRSSMSSRQPPHMPPSSPPPLGQWPRKDAVEQPLRIKRKQPLYTSGLSTESPVGSSPSSTTTSPVDQPSPTRTKPLGPRRKSGSSETHRPPPLDLTSISSFKG